MSFYNREELENLGFKTLGSNVSISNKCSFYNVENISIGNNVRIDDYVILSAGVGGIEISNFVHIACFSTIIGKGRVVMKDYSGLSSRVSVYSSSDNYDGEFMTNPCLPENLTNTTHEDILIGKHVVVGSGSIILPGVVLADGCAVGALSLVNKSVSGQFIIAGVPAKIIGPRKSNIFELEKRLSMFEK